MLLWLLAACARPSAPEAPEPEPEIADYSEAAARWADSVVACMSDAELVGQVLMPALYADTAAANVRLLRHYADSVRTGGILLLRGDTPSALRLGSLLACSSRVVPFVAIDAEWGLGMRLRDAPSYTPFGRLPAATTDLQLYDYGYSVGRQARQAGINVVFAPVLDVATSARSAIGFRSFGSDPQRVAELGVAFARGIEDSNVLSVAKHFPGLGSSAVDSHKAQPVIASTRARLDSVDLYPFAQYIRQQLSGIMISHAAYPALDSVARSACLSPPVQTDLLRGQLGFGGLIFTDALNMRGLGSAVAPEVEALLAGANIIVAPADTDRAAAELRAALRRGALPRALLRQRVRRILLFKYPLALAAE